MATRPMQVWNGSAWEDIGPQAPATAIVVQSSAPTGDSGKLWIDTSADVPTYANMAPTASPSFTGTSTFAGPVTMSGGAVSMSGATSVTGGGMDLITPTSVAGSGVTLSGGEVSFSASTTISVNGVFTATYDNYRMVWELSLAAGEQNLGIRMRLSGTDNSSANYTSQYFFADGGSTGQARQTGQTSHLTTNVSVNRTFGVTEIGSPALAQRTAFMTNSTVDASTPTTRFYTGAQTQATAFDGISLIPSASSMTGKLRIYGLRKS